jgi:hypothetical protein
VADARAWAAKTGLLALPAFADRLEGQTALAAGDVELGLKRLRRARDTSARLEAAWDRARTELILASALLEADDRLEAAEILTSALSTLTALEAPVETKRARDLIARAT